MSKFSVGLAMATCLAIVSLAMPSVQAQPTAPTTPAQPAKPEAGRGGDRGGRGARGGGLVEAIKESMKASDEEWAVLQPRIEKVSTIQRESRGGGMRGFGGRGGPSGGNAPADQPQSEVSKAREALQTTLTDEKADTATVKAKLEAFRAAKAASAANLVKAQKELREIVTPRQEAQLVMFGLLD